MQVRLFTLLMVFSLLPVKGEETILQQVPVPNRMLRQGDALLIESGDGIGVRIDLHTRHLKKVEEKILEAETGNWPASPDSQRYLTLLRRACAEAQQLAEGKVAFSIEWWLTSPEKGHVRLRYAGRQADLADLSSAYLQKNLAYIIADHFDMSAGEAAAWISIKMSPPEVIP